jgi:imidazolonepropionase-like amidohydrolase
LKRLQAAVAHAFHLPEQLALQSVTSVPAKSLELDHRIGYVRPGYDADIVIWNSHPLSVGATPLQVYIDGKSTLDPEKVAQTLPMASEESQQRAEKPKMRVQPEPAVKEKVCGALAAKRRATLSITGITKSFLDFPTDMPSAGHNFTMVLEDGRLICLGSEDTCISSSIDHTIIKLENGHIIPGLTALSSALGLAEITGLEETKDGTVSGKLDVLDADNVVYAKYGVHLNGKSFKRARIGGVTRAITAPITGDGFLSGVSVGIKTSGKKTILDGGIFQDDVALHLIIGQEVKGK